MKKETRKNVRYGVDIIISLGYCEYHEKINQLKDRHSNSYCAGVYGWDCDNIYVYFNDKMVCISTGYKPIKSNISKEEQEKLLQEIFTYEGV